MKAQVVLGILAFAAIAAAQTPAPPTPPAPPAAPAPAARPRPVTPRVERRVVVQPDDSGYLGIGVAEVTSERAKALRLKEERGAEVTSVAADSPAAKAGFKEGDVVLEYNGQAVQSRAQLTRMVEETPPDRQVKVVVWRNGGQQTLTATLGTRRGVQAFGSGDAGQIFRRYGLVTPPTPPLIDIPHVTMSWQNPRLGIVGESLGQEQQLADFFGVEMACW